ncbi:MAG: hypothetical protein ACYDBS_04530, partial [Acidimicrobiales bacterium]
MPEPHEPESGVDDIVGLTDLKSSEPFELPVADSFGTAPLLAAEVAGDPTARPVAPSMGRKWYQGLGWGFWIAAGWVILWILLAIFANLLPLDSATIPSLTCSPGAGISAAHPLGCNLIDEDVLAQVIFGARVSLVVGFVSIALSIVVGGICGIISGYFRGPIDRVLTVVANVFLSFPSLVLGLVIVAY